MSDNVSLDSLLNSIVMGEQANGLNKEASAAPSAADELETLLKKEASESNGEKSEMSNVASSTGKEIANGILGLLTKSAENMVQADLNKLETAHDQRIELNPVQGKTVAEMAQAIMARAASNGGATAPAVLAQESAAEGKAQADVPGAVASDLNKQASEAVSMLIADGASFDDAVELVKQAQEQLFGESIELEKAAAVSQLVSEGLDFEDAAALVKQASDELYGTGDLELEKAAAVNQLVSEGLDFEDAAALVKQAAAELYGEEETYSEIEKAAAVNQLVAEGIDFEDAAALVKEAAVVKWTTGKETFGAKAKRLVGGKAGKAAKIAGSIAGSAALAGGGAALMRKKND